MLQCKDVFFLKLRICQKSSDDEKGTSNTKSASCALYANFQSDTIITEKREGIQTVMLAK